MQQRRSFPGRREDERVEGMVNGKRIPGGSKLVMVAGEELPIWEVVYYPDLDSVATAVTRSCSAMRRTRRRVPLTNPTHESSTSA
jgi:hypothetical protein